MNYQDVETDMAPASIIPPPVLDKETVGFADLGVLPEIVTAVQNMGWKEPTPVQRMSLPLTLVGREIAAFAQTGTGKTGVFLITFAQRILERRKAEGDAGKHIKGVVLVPTRELAIQITQDADGMFGQLGLKSLAIYGGENWDKQKNVLETGSVDLVVATPGRLKDYEGKNIADLSKCNFFICDEVDRMFDMGFIEDVEHFLGKIPETCQKLLFSATTSEQVKELAFAYLEQPEYISLIQDDITPDRIAQHAIICSANQKLKVMLGLLRDHQPACALIFANTKLVAEWLYYKLTRNSIDADLITGDLPQQKRTKLIKRIKEGNIKVLIATDVVSRGLHIAGVTHVYNFDIPEEAANYVHRIGRTARAGATGQAFSLICEDYGENFEDVKKLLGDHAPAADWFPDRYLEIEDQAPDPFAAENISLEVEKDKPSDSDSHYKRRGASAERFGNKERGGRNQGGRDQGGRDQAGGKGQKFKGRDHDDRKSRHDGPKRFDNRSDGKRGRPDRDQHHKQRDRKPMHGTSAARGVHGDVVKKQPMTFKGLLKRIMSLFTGKSYK